MGSATGPAGRSPLPTDHRPVIRDVVRDVLTETAPEEVPLFAALDNSKLDDDRVVRLLSRRTRRREPLGFGPDDLVPLAMPVVWLALEEMARRGAGAAADSVISRLRAGIRMIFRRRAASHTMPALTKEQIATVRQRVLERAEEAGIRGARAVTLADGVVARLALELPGKPTSPGGSDRADDNGRTGESGAAST